MSDASEAYALLTDAEPAYTTAHLYYSGEIVERFDSRRLQRVLGKPGAWRLNLAKTPVDAAADRLELLAVTVPNDDASTQRLGEIWDANAMLFEAPNIMRRACEFGDAFVLVWEGAEEGDLPVINYLAPGCARMVYDRDNPRKKRYFAHRWTEKDEGGKTWERLNLWYADRLEKWQTKPGTLPEEPASWVPLTDEEGDYVFAHEYEQVPAFHFRTGTPYGKPLHYDGYATQDAFNKLFASQMATVDFQVAPQRYGLKELGAEADDDFDLDEDDAFPEDSPVGVTAQQRDQSGHDAALRSGPGEFWDLKGYKGVGEFSAADPDAFLKPMGFYMRIMATLTTTPFEAFDESADEPSGESRRRKEAPFTKKVRDLQQMFASEWAALFSFALKVAGVKDAKVDVRFAPAEVVSDAQGWATVKTKLEAGVPVRRALLETGYTAEQVDEWYPEGDENVLRVEDLAQVADILQKLGSAVALGLVTAEEARAMLPEGVVPETAGG